VFLEEEEAGMDDDGHTQPAVVSQSFLVASSLGRALGTDDAEEIDPEEYSDKVSL
jgi:hypothetical protein